MNFESVYFYMLMGSGAASAVFGALLWKDLSDRKVSPLVWGVQATQIIWFVVFLALWFMDSPGAAGVGDAFVIVFSALFIGILHVPVGACLITGSVISAFEGMIEPKSGIVVQKSYDEAERAETRHEYEKALELYRAEGERDPADATVRLRIGEVLARMGRLEDAVTEFSSLLDMPFAGSADLTRAIFRAAEISAGGLGKKTKARVLVEAALRRNVVGPDRGILEARLKVYS